MKRIGLVGLGAMGSGMASNLLAKGFELAVFARDAAKAQPFVDRGARRAESPAELAATCEAVITCVSDTRSVEEVLFGERGIASGANGTLRYVVDTSTISAHATRDFHARLSARGIGFIDAPVSGGGKGAQEGTLACMAGGTREDFDECLPVLQAFSKSVTRVGESGAGQVCKACNQVCVVANLLGAAEMIAICIKNGIDPMQVREVLLASTGRSAVLENHALRVLRQTFLPAGFRADLLLKDLRLVRELESADGICSPVTAAAEPLMAQLVEEAGGEVDWTAVAMLMQRLSGINAPPPAP